MESDDTLYAALGVGSSATREEIKSAFRKLAKTYHPDKSNNAETKSRFQEINHAYHVLMKSCDTSNVQNSDSNVSELGLQCSWKVKENTYSVTIDLADIILLPFVEQCKLFYDVDPTDRGPNGLQFSFPYTSPDELESYGSISLTFYATTARLHVQGSSYLLWIAEHLPGMFEQAETNFLENAGRWTTKAKSLKIGFRRKARPATPNNLHALMTYRRHRTTHCLPPPAPTSLSPDATAVCVNTVADALSSTAVATGLAVEATTVTGVPLPISPVSDNQSGVAVASLSSPQSVAANDTAVISISSSPVSTTLSDGALVVTSVTPPSRKPPGTPPPRTRRRRTVRKTASPVSVALVVTDGTPPPRRKPLKTPIRKTVSAKPSTTKAKHKKAPPKTRAKHAVTNQKNCVDTCTASDDSEHPMIRCSMCMTWIHVMCAGEEATYAGVWTCASCSILPVTVNNLADKFDQMLANQGQIMSCLQEVQANQACYADHTATLLRDELSLVKSWNARLTSKLEHVEQHNADLQKLITTMSFPPVSTEPDTPVSPSNTDGAASTQPGSRGTWVPTVTTRNGFGPLLVDSDGTSDTLLPQSTVSAAPSSQPRKRTTVTVVGSSVVRDVASFVDGKQSDGSAIDAVGFVYRGCTARQINSRLRCIPQSDVLVLAAGTNNV